MKLHYLFLPVFALPLHATPATSQTEAAAVLASQKRNLLPLPDFHESWTEAEVQCIKSFAAKFSHFYDKQPFANHAKEDLYPFICYLHQVITTGEVNATFGTADAPDTLARYAAIVDDLDAVKLFISKGENPATSARHADFDTEFCLAQEIIWSETLTVLNHTAEERIALLEWLKTQGWNPQVNQNSIIFAVCVAAMAEHQNVLPLFEWINNQQFEQTAIITDHYMQAALHGVGATPVVRQLVEMGALPLNEPLLDLLPLQHICSHPLLENIINLDTLQYLLEAGADPNLMLADETVEHPDAEYRQEDFEAEDTPLEGIDSYATPIERIFDSYRFDMVYANETETDKKRIKSYLAAIDLLLLHGAELDIEEDEAGDEDAESAAYAEARKRLRMTPEQLRADYEAIRHSL
ncbi:MAG: hypothetical protein IJ993_01310 [Akkermansia sp.]|nr:hypothetical protein [Akkermansia sp.]